MPPASTEPAAADTVTCC